MPSTWCCLRQRNEHHMPTMRTSRNWRTTLSASWGRLPVDEPQMLTTTAQYKPLHSVRAVVVVPERLFSMASKAQQQVTFGNCHMASALSKKRRIQALRWVSKSYSFHMSHRREETLLTVALVLFGLVFCLDSVALFSVFPFPTSRVSFS